MTPGLWVPIVLIACVAVLFAPTLVVQVEALWARWRNNGRGK